MVKRELKLCIENALYSSTVRENYETNLLESKKCLEALYDGTGKGSNFTGWVNLPSSITEELLSDIEATAKRLREECTYVVMIGIGGSYLGTKAVVEALSDSFALLKPTCGARLLYAGHHISEDYLSELIELLKGEKFGIINISKSGTTTEPAIAFRLLKSLLEEQEGLSFAQKHIIAITDERKGALRQLANNQGYKTYVIPDNVGGRFSVLTPVGLLPISVAGFDIRRLIAGAKNMEEELASTSISEIKNNTAAQYAAIRLALYNEGKKIEILGNYHPKLQYFNEWWKQLYGESEGKDGKGIFPASVTFTTDLHSMGQWIQDGVRNIFETIISVKNPNRQLEIPHDEVNLDGLNFISGRTIDYVNKMAEQGTQLAHIDGGVPNIKIEIEQLDAYAVGQLFYFFELAVGISGYLLDVNPFDQPGVEAYKNNMFALLEKPGFEKETNKLKERLKRL